MRTRTAVCALGGLLSAAIAASLLAAAPASQRSPLVDGAPLSLPRAGHSATLLADGRVLVAGGCASVGCDGATGRTELFLPGAARFAAGPALRRARVGQAAVRLRSGKVLLAGGWVSGEATAAAELFDPNTNRFTTTASMGTARGSPTATLLRDGRVLLVGGADDTGPLASAEVFDPTTELFAPTGPASTPHEAHAAVLLADGRVAVFGGSIRRGRVLRTVEIWDPTRGEFQPGGQMSVPRHKLAAMALADGHVLIVGGSDARDFRGRHRSAELFDPRSGSSRPLPPMRGMRFKLLDAVVRLPDGSVLIAGGNRIVERYGPRRGRFSTVGSIGGDFAFATATVLGDGRVLIAGGYDQSVAPTRRTWIYQPAER